MSFNIAAHTKQDQSICGCKMCINYRSYLIQIELSKLTKYQERH